MNKIEKQEGKGEMESVKKEKKGGLLFSWKSEKSLSTKAINITELCFSDVFSSPRVVRSSFNYATQNRMS